MAKIVIDGVTYEVNGDNNLLQECLSQGLDLPYFCWHPCMGSVGACRQCAVKQYRNEDDKDGTLVMACMTPAADGSIISIEDEQARKFRANVIESLMISHPHDCPVCEEGGECHLQDMTLMSGHNYRRYDYKKVTHRNQYLGPFIGHEMNRCITCYRCVRYYDDYAGGTDLSAQASHHHTYFGRQSDGCLESEFSGNLVEVCPTGVFTDATFSEHYTRKWDLQTAPAVCVGCSVGCNTTPGERYGELRRIVNRYHADINGYFLCDRGRFGYGFVNSDQRLVQSYTGRAGQREPLTREAAETALDELLQQSPPGGVLGIGSPRADIESNFALMKRVGSDNFYAGVSDGVFEATGRIIELLRDPEFHTPSVREIEAADAVLILGEDVTNTAPRIALALRQAVRNRADELAAAAKIPAWQDAAVRELAQQELSPLYILAGYATRLDDVACATVVDSGEQIAALGNAVAHGIDERAPEPAGFDGGEPIDLIGRIVEDLKSARRPLIVTGTGSGSIRLVEAAANIARALYSARGGDKPVDLCCLTPEVNSIGLGLMTASENSLGSALERMSGRQIETVIVLENDLYRHAPAGRVDQALDSVKDLVVVDQLNTPTAEKASLLLASTTFAEQKSTYINYEGRAQLSMQVFISPHAGQPAWSWLNEDRSQDHDAVLGRCASEVNSLAGVDGVLPAHGMIAGLKIPRQPHRYSGRTAMHAHHNVHESKQPQDQDSLMAFSMEGMSGRKDATFVASSWAPRWNSNQSISKFQDEVGGELRQGHPGRLLLTKNKETGPFYQPAGSVGRTNGGFTVIPAYQLFGSDELSNYAQPVASRLIGSYVALAPIDARQLGVTTADRVEVGAEAGKASFPVCIRTRVKPGTAVLFIGADDSPLARPGETVELTVSAGDPAVKARFDNLIVSDLPQGGVKP